MGWGPMETVREVKTERAGTILRQSSLLYGNRHPQALPCGKDSVEHSQQR